MLIAKAGSHLKIAWMRGTEEFCCFFLYLVELQRDLVSINLCFVNHGVLEKRFLKDSENSRVLWLEEKRLSRR